MILFAGDSFSAWDDEESWTYHFAKDIGLGFRNCSIEGSSLWTAFSQLDVEDYKFFNNYYEYLILTCTNYRRIPYCVNLHMSNYFGKIEVEPLDTEEKKHNMAHVNYYDRFYDEKMHKFFYERTLEFIITKFGKHTKIVLLPVIQDSLYTIKKANEIWKEDFTFINFPLMDIRSHNPKHKNHFTKEINESFGKLLAKKVQQTNYGCIDLSVKEIKEALK